MNSGRPSRRRVDTTAAAIPMAGAWSEGNEGSAEAAQALTTRKTRPSIDDRTSGRSWRYGVRKAIGPMKDSAVECVSFESIEIVRARGFSGGSPKIL